MTFTVEAYQPAHYLEATRVIAPERFYHRDPDVDAEGKLRGPAFSGFVDGALAGCAGVLPVPGTGRASLWAVLTDVGRAHPMFVHRAVVRTLVDLADRLGLVRLEAEAVKEFHAGCDWLEAIGQYLIRKGWQPDYFNLKQGRCAPVHAPKAGPGGVDFYRYGWFR